MTFKALLSTDPEPVFTFVDPPFDLNDPSVSKYPPEVTGFFLLNSLCRRLGWNSLAGKRLLDFGCGVRFARAIINLGLEIGCYTGVDVNAESISWLSSNIKDPRFRFERLDMKNQMYNLQGTQLDKSDRSMLARLGLCDFDAACMFSVITHQAPDDAHMIFSMLRECVRPGGSLYFTAFIDETVETYVERDPSNVCLLSTYNPDFLLTLVERSGWCPSATYRLSDFQQAAFVCQ